MKFLESSRFEDINSALRFQTGDCLIRGRFVLNFKNAIGYFHCENILKQFAAHKISYFHIT